MDGNHFDPVCLAQHPHSLAGHPELFGHFCKRQVFGDHVHNPILVNQLLRGKLSFTMGMAGVEPARCNHHQILKVVTTTQGQFRMSTLTINRGSDLDFTIIWRDSAGDPVDLTGYSVAAYDTTPTLSMTLSITDAAAGEITGRLNWDEAYATARPVLGDMVVSFRVRITNGNDDTTTPLITVRIV